MMYMCRVHVQISGMTCGSCVHHIETEIVKQMGVLSASVALATARGRFTFDSQLTGVRSIIEALNVSLFDTVLSVHADGLTVRNEVEMQPSRLYN